MAVFAWEAKTRAGEVRTGLMEAASEDAVRQRLLAQQLTPVHVKKKMREINISFGTGVQTKDMVVFTRQFATMIDAGLPLVQCLDILGNSTENRAFGKILLDVKERVEAGATFSDALRAHPRVFDELFCNLVGAGEVGGILDTIMNRLAVYIEKAQKLKSKVKGAMVYPISVMFIAMGVVTLLLWKVIPVFENMFKDMGAGALPAPTRIVMGISHGFIGNLHFIVAGSIAAAGGFTAFIRSPKGKLIWHAVILKLPIVGPVLRRQTVARFSRTLGTLLTSGVPLLDALEVTAKTAGNTIVERAVRFVSARVSEGRDLAGPLGETGVFPPMVVQMIGVGEHTGAMDTMLQKIADFYEEEVDVAVDAMTKMMEPLMMVFLGGIVGGVIIAMYMPIFELAGSVKAE
ncbi:MAG: type II secretion system F family protein [Myxococcota bacterium]